MAYQVPTKPYSIESYGGITILVVKNFNRIVSPESRYNNIRDLVQSAYLKGYIKGAELLSMEEPNIDGALEQILDQNIHQFPWISRISGNPNNFSFAIANASAQLLGLFDYLSSRGDSEGSKRVSVLMYHLTEEIATKEVLRQTVEDGKAFGIHTNDFMGIMNTLYSMKGYNPRTGEWDLSKLDSKTISYHQDLEKGVSARVKNLKGFLE